MKLKFKATQYRQQYWSQEYHLKDGDVVDIHPTTGQKWLERFPNNFIDLTPKPLPELKAIPLVSILIPQRGRPTYINKCLELILENTTYPKYEVILICDRDDIDSIATIPEDERIKVRIDPSPKRQMYVGKINYGFRISKADYVVYLANDVEVSKNWLTEAMKSMQTISSNSGLVAFNHGGSVQQAYHGLVSRQFCNKFLRGNIFYPGYIHFWCDLELNAIAKKLNRFSFSTASRVSHNSPQDALHKEAWEKTQEQGRQLLVKRRKLGFPYTLKISEISIVNIYSRSPEILQRNLLSYLPKQIDFIQIDNHNNKNFSSAAKAFNFGIKKAKNNVVICVHEDILFKKTWFKDFVKQEYELKNWGALGIVGMVTGKSHHWWGHSHNEPREAETLDECCIIINKKNDIWFDEKTFTRWHSYGVDLCLQCRQKGLKVYIIAGKAYHDDSGKTSAGLQLPQEWRNIIHQKWGKIFGTIHTTTGVC